MILFLLFILIPIVEIYLFIELGGQIGAAWTILLILLTAIVGVFCVKRQGLSLLFNMQKKMRENQVPAIELFDGLCVLIAGLLLITPGFFTDAIGFLLLWEGFRNFLRISILDGVIGSFSFGLADTDTVKWGHEKFKEGRSTQQDDQTVEAEFIVVKKEKKSSNK